MQAGPWLKSFYPAVSAGAPIAAAAAVESAQGPPVQGEGAAQKPPAEGKGVAPEPGKKRKAAGTAEATAAEAAAAGGVNAAAAAAGVVASTDLDVGGEEEGGEEEGGEEDASASPSAMLSEPDAAKAASRMATEGATDGGAAGSKGKKELPGATGKQVPASGSEASVGEGRGAGAGEHPLPVMLHPQVKTAGGPRKGAPDAAAAAVAADAAPAAATSQEGHPVEAAVVAPAQEEAGTSAQV